MFSGSIFLAGLYLRCVLHLVRVRQRVILVLFFTNGVRKHAGLWPVVNKASAYRGRRARIQATTSRSGSTAATEPERRTESGRARTQRSRGSPAAAASNRRAASGGTRTTPGSPCEPSSAGGRAGARCRSEAKAPGKPSLAGCRTNATKRTATVRRNQTDAVQATAPGKSGGGSQRSAAGG